MTMTDDDRVCLRLTEDGPIRHRDRHISVGRGRTVWATPGLAETLLEERDYFERVCATVKDDGERCPRAAADCPYHGDTDTDADADADEGQAEAEED